LNLYDSDWDVERSYGDARMRMTHIGRRLGSELLGATLFEIEPGIAGLYHFHHGNEEWALVLDGTLTLRTSEGERELRPGDVAVFPRGPDGAHALGNRSDSVCRVAVFSSMRDPDVVEYPDSGVLGAIAGDAPTAGRDAPFEAFFRLSDQVGYADVTGHREEHPEG
jgi:uncharacterized cupin superfamily protein